jgi:hypothetical protein
LRFDNPIYDHDFVFPDLAEFPGVESEPRFLDTPSVPRDLEVMQRAFENNDWNTFSSTFYKYSQLDKKTRARVKTMFDFYSWFPKSRKHTDLFPNNEAHDALYEQGFYAAQVDLDEVKTALEPSIEKLYEQEDWVPPIGTMDRGCPVSKDVRRMIQQTLADAGLMDAAGKYLARERALKVGSAYLVVGTPTDSHWKQFYQDQTYVSKTTNLHIDPVEDQIKVMLYLNDVGLESGPFSYVPQSNRWMHDDLQNIFGRAIATGSYCDTPEKRASIFRLPKHLRVSYNFGRTLVDHNPLQQRIIGTEQLLVSANTNCIVFDPAGMHRGGICESKDRIAIQVLLK